MKMEEARDFFSSSVSNLLLWFEDRSLWGMTHDGRQIQSIQLLPVNVSGWKTDLTLAAFLVFLSGSREHFQICFSHDFRASIEYGLLLCLSQCSEGGDELSSYRHKRLVFAELFLCVRRETGTPMWLIPAAFCGGEAVGCCTQLTEEHLKQIRSVSFTHLLCFSSLCRPVLCLLSCLCFRVWFGSCRLKEEAVYESAWITPLLPWCKNASKVLQDKSNNCLQGVALWKAGKGSFCPLLGPCGSVKTFWFEKYWGQFREQRATVCNSICPQLP